MVEPIKQNIGRKKTMAIWRNVLAGAVGLAVAAGATLAPKSGAIAQEGDFPVKPITIIVPFAPGGRTDTVARMIAQAIQENGFLDQPMTILNVAGGAGAPAVAALMAEDADGHTIMHYSYDALISIAMDLGKFELEQFTSLGFTGGGSPVWTVRDDAPYDSLQDLIDHLQANPRSLVEAVGIGQIPHLVGAMLAKEAEFETRLVTANSGADRMRLLLGGNADIALFAASEYLNSEGIKALVYFGNSRLPEMPDVPTSSELGFATNWANPNWWLAPAGTPDAVVAKLSEALEKAISLPAMQEYFTSNTLEPYWMSGPDSMAAASETLVGLRVVAAEIR
jgi:putative tricarboxylic transport membrane protein